MLALKKKKSLKIHHLESCPDKIHLLFYFIRDIGLNLAEITILKCQHHPYNTLMATSHAKEVKYLDLVPSSA